MDRDGLGLDPFLLPFPSAPNLTHSELCTRTDLCSPRGDPLRRGHVSDSRGVVLSLAPPCVPSSGQTRGRVAFPGAALLSQVSAQPVGRGHLLLRWPSQLGRLCALAEPQWSPSEQQQPGRLGP